MENLANEDPASLETTPFISPNPSTFTNLPDSPTLINPYNIPFYQNIKQILNRTSQKDTLQIGHYKRILQSLAQYPLPLYQINDFLWLNGIDNQTAETLAAINGNNDSGLCLSEFKKQCLTHARHFCKLLLSKRQIKTLHLSIRPTLQTSPVNAIESSKRVYTPLTGGPSWTALIILFILHTNTNNTNFRLAELVNLSDMLLKIIPCSKVNVKSLSKLIRFNLVTFRNDLFKTKKTKTNDDRPKRFMTKLADMYNYSITEDGLSVGRNLIVKVKVPIQTLIETIISNYNNNIDDENKLKNSNINMTLPRPIKTTYNHTSTNKPSNDSLEFKSNDLNDNVKESRLNISNTLQNIDDIDYTIKRTLDTTQNSLMADDPLSLKARKSDVTYRTIPNLDDFLENIISKSESDNFSDDNYRLNLSPTSLSSDYNISMTKDSESIHLTGNDTFDDGNYHLVVVIDNREFGGARLKYYDLLIDILKGENIRYKIFTLPLGDIVWVCHRDKSNNDLPRHKNNSKNGLFGGGETYVLNWIIERKTASDLHSSILDGRYDEQRQRLLESGMKQIIYLYEGCVDTVDTSGSYWKKHVNPKIFSSAKSNIQFINGFNVINASSPSHTAAYIVRFHRQLESLICEMSGINSINQMTDIDNEKLSIWLKNSENSCPWDSWIVQTRKDYNITYKHIFGKQLKCIPSCGPIAIASILCKWPTPKELAMALAEDEDALSSLLVGKKKFIGKKVFKSKLAGEAYSKIIQFTRLNVN